MDPRLKKARLPANLRSNRSDIKDLNDRASLLKIIGDRKLTLKKREELMKEYNLIMTDLYNKQKKKKKSLARSRGGVRTSRSWEKRRAETYKRGERRKEGEDEPETIGEVVGKDSEGNLRITYRDYNEEERLRLGTALERDVEQLRIEARQDFIRAEQEARLDEIRRQDIALRHDERARDRQDRELRDRENYGLQREFRNRDDAFRDLQLRGENDRAFQDRLIRGRQLDQVQEGLSGGQDILEALRNLDRRFDLAEAQFRNLRGAEVEFVPPPDYSEIGYDEEGVPGAIPTEEDVEDETPPPRRAPSEAEPPQLRPTTPRLVETPRYYTEDRQPRGGGRSLKEDFEILRQQGYRVGDPGTAERVEFETAVGEGNIDRFKEDALGVVELLPRAPSAASTTGSIKYREILKQQQRDPSIYSTEELEEEFTNPYEGLEASKQSAEEIRYLIDDDRRQIELLKTKIEQDKKAKLDQSLDELRGDVEPTDPGRIQALSTPNIEIENPLETFTRLERQRTLNSLQPGRQYTDESAETIGFLNPLNTPEEDRDVLSAEEGAFVVGSQRAIQSGISQTSSDASEVREIVIDGITYEIRDDGIFDVKTGFEVTNDVEDLNPDEWIMKGRKIHARNQGIENYDFKDRDFFSKLKRAAPPPPPPQARVIDALREIPIDDQGKAFGGRLEAPTFGVDEFDVYHEDIDKRLFDFEDDVAHGDFYDRREEITDNITEQKALDIRGYLEEHGKGSDDGYDTDDFEALGFDDNDTDLTFDDAEKFGPDAVRNITERMYDDADADLDNILKQDWNSVKQRIGDRKITKKEAQREFKRKFLELGAEEQVPGFETEIEARLDIPTPADAKAPSVEEPSPEVESAPPSQSSAQKKLTSKDTSNPANFIPGYFEPKQEVMYYRKDNKGKGLWRPAEVVDYQDGGEVGPLLSVKRTTGSGVKKQQVETTMDRVIPKPNPGELLKQKKLREELAGGVIDRAQDWVDRDKFVLHNNTAQELYGIKPNGKSVIGYHKKTFGGGENTYFHTPLDDDGKYIGKKDGRNLGPKFLDPSVNNGLLSLQKLDEVFKEGNAIADLDLSFQLAPPLPQQVSETLPLPASASSTSSDSVFEEFKEFNYSELRDENPELSEAELQSLLRREYDKL